MTDERIKITSYSGYRDEEVPRSFFLDGRRIEIIELLDMWIEETLSDRTRRRFFKVRGSDGFTHRIYRDERRKEWYRQVR